MVINQNILNAAFPNNKDAQQQFSTIAEKYGNILDKYFDLDSNDDTYMNDLIECANELNKWGILTNGTALNLFGFINDNCGGVVPDDLSEDTLLDINDIISSRGVSDRSAEIFSNYINSTINGRQNGLQVNIHDIINETSRSGFNMLIPPEPITGDATEDSSSQILSNYGITAPATKILDAFKQNSTDDDTAARKYVLFEKWTTTPSGEKIPKQQQPTIQSCLNKLASLSDNELKELCNTNPNPNTLRTLLPQLTITPQTLLSTIKKSGNENHAQQPKHPTETPAGGQDKPKQAIVSDYAQQIAQFIADSGKYVSNIDAKDLATKIVGSNIPIDEMISIFSNSDAKTESDLQTLIKHKTENSINDLTTANLLSKAFGERPANIDSFVTQMPVLYTGVDQLPLYILNAETIKRIQKIAANIKSLANSKDCGFNDNIANAIQFLIDMPDKTQHESYPVTNIKQIIKQMQDNNTLADISANGTEIEKICLTKSNNTLSEFNKWVTAIKNAGIDLSTADASIIDFVKKLNAVDDLTKKSTQTELGKLLKQSTPPLAPANPTPPVNPQTKTVKLADLFNADIKSNPSFVKAITEYMRKHGNTTGEITGTQDEINTIVTEIRNLANQNNPTGTIQTPVKPVTPAVQPQQTNPTAPVAPTTPTAPATPAPTAPTSPAAPAAPTAPAVQSPSAPAPQTGTQPASIPAPGPANQTTSPDPRTTYQPVYDAIKAHAMSPQQADLASTMADDIFMHPGHDADAYFKLVNMTSSMYPVIFDLLDKADPANGHKETMTPSEANTNDLSTVEFINNPMSQHKPKRKLFTDFTKPAGMTMGSADIWDAPIIESMGFPFVNFSNETVRDVLTGDDKAKKSAYNKLKSKLKDINIANKHVGGIFDFFTDKPIKLLKEFAGKGNRCKPNWLRVETNDLNSASPDSLIMVTPIKQFTRKLEYNKPQQVTMTMLNQFYKLLDVDAILKADPSIIKKYMGMTVDELANQYEANGNQMPYYLLYPKLGNGISYEIYDKSTGSIFSSIFRTKQNCKAVKVKFKGHDGRFIMPKSVANALYTET